MRVDWPSSGLDPGAQASLAVPGGWWSLAVPDTRGDVNCSAGGYAAGTLIGAGLGTAIGVGVDALIYHKREIYRRAGGAHGAVAPAIGRGVRGAVVSLTW